MGGEFHSDSKCKLVVEDGGAGGRQWNWGVGDDRRKRGVSQDTMVCFSRNELKMEATARIQTAWHISLALSPMVQTGSRSHAHNHCPDLVRGLDLPSQKPAYLVVVTYREGVLFNGHCGLQIHRTSFHVHSSELE